MSAGTTPEAFGVRALAPSPQPSPRGRGSLQVEGIRAHGIRHIAAIRAAGRTKKGGIVLGLLLAFAAPDAALSQGSPKLAKDLDALLSGTHAARQVNVVVYLVRQPGPVIGRSVRQQYAPAMNALSEQIRWISRLSMPTVSLSPAEEKAFTPKPLSPELSLWSRSLAEQLDELRDRMLADISASVGQAVALDHALISRLIVQLGGTVRSATAVLSTVAGTLPAGSVPRLAADPSVAYVTFDHPGKPELDNHRTSLGLTTGFWLNGFDGGVHDAGVLDTGVFQAHPNLASHRFESNAGAGDPNGHGTGMAGILASDHASFRGMAWGLDTICVAIAGADSTSMSGMNYLVTGTVERPENVNYSFGNGIASDTDYSPFDKFFDGVIDTFGVMVSKSTGNSGWGTTTITHPAPAYNLMASANMDDFNSVLRLDHRITSSSSRGPTLGGRKKPDITAPGTNTMTTNTSGGFSDLGGTSSASPHTGGGVILLHQLGTVEPFACKAVLLNAADAITDNNTQTTSDDAYVPGSLWNKTYGWGYLDLGEAYINGLDVFVETLTSPSAGSREFKLFKGQMFAGEKSTLAWNRHVAYAGALYPTEVETLSNLDLTAWRESDGASLDGSASLIDNVEQVDVTTDEPVVLTVTAVAPFDPDVPEETFALATEENFVAAVGPSLSIAFHYPSRVSRGQEFQLTVGVTNSGDLPAHGNTVLLSGITVVSGANPQPLPVIRPGETRDATWQVRASDTPGNQIISAGATSASYGETFDAGGKVTLMVGDLEVVLPDSMNIFRGRLVSGTLEDLFVSDDLRVLLNPGQTLSTAEAPVQVVLEGTAPTSTPTALQYVLEASTLVPDIEQTLDMFNYATQSYERLDSRASTLTDSVVEVVAVGNLARFVDPVTSRMKTRLSWRAVGPVLSYPWLVRIDQAVWKLGR